MNCNKCGFDKGDSKKCKNCAQIYQKNYYLNNKDRLAAHAKIWYEDNKQEILLSRKEYRENNQEYIIAYRKSYYENNKDELSLKSKEWYENNKEDILKDRKEYYEENKEEISVRTKQYSATHKKERNEREKERLQNDPIYRLRKNCSSTISAALKGNKKHLSILKYLEYTMEQLKEHLEKQFQEPGNEWMNWDNYGTASIYKRTWQIDHIIPQSKLPYTSMTDDNFKKCWVLDNLRPLDAVENIRKYNKVKNDAI